jgi:cation transport ATPase
MSCAACTNTVERAARRVPGVASASASVLAGTAAVTWRNPPPPRCGTPADVAAIIRAAGYSADVVSAADARSAAFRLAGMCCAACPARIVAALRALPGVGAVALEEQACKVRVAFDAEATGPRAIRDALVSLGYDAEPLAPEDAAGGADEAAAEIAEWRRLFLGALLFTAPLVVLMMVLPYIPAANRVIMFELLPARLRRSSAAGAHAGMAGMAGGDAPASMSGGRSLPLMSVLAWALATPVQFVFGARFMVGCALCCAFASATPLLLTSVTLLQGGARAARGRRQHGRAGRYWHRVRSSSLGIA